MTKIHDNRSAECSGPSCPCHAWSARMPSELPALPEREVGRPVSEAENVLSRKETPGIALSAFIQRWNAAPESSRRVTEQEIAEYFYLCGRQDEKSEGMELLNEDLRELLRLASERLR